MDYLDDVLLCSEGLTPQLQLLPQQENSNSSTAVSMGPDDMCENYVDDLWGINSHYTKVVDQSGNCRRPQQITSGTAAEIYDVRSHHQRNSPLITTVLVPGRMRSGPKTYLALGEEEEAISNSKYRLGVLLHKESQFLPHPTYVATMRRDAHLRARRSTAVHWMLETCKILGFSSPLTPALAVNYLDRYLALNYATTDRLSVTSTSTWTLELVALACLSIAAKMEEVDVPALSDLQVFGLEQSFQCGMVQQMELAVMDSLNWKLRSVTAVTFAEEVITALADVKGKGLHGGGGDDLLLVLLERSMELILRGLSEVELLGFTASAVALAAVQCALDENFPIQAKAGLADYLASFIPLSLDDAARCRRTLEELVVDPPVLLHVPVVVDTSGSQLLCRHNPQLYNVVTATHPYNQQVNTTNNDSNNSNNSSGSTSPTGVLQLHNLISLPLMASASSCINTTTSASTPLTVYMNGCNQQQMKKVEASVISNLQVIHSTSISEVDDDGATAAAAAAYHVLDNDVHNYLNVSLLQPYHPKMMSLSTTFIPRDPTARIILDHQARASAAAADDCGHEQQLPQRHGQIPAPPIITPGHYAHNHRRTMVDFQGAAAAAASKRQCRYRDTDSA